MFNQDMAKKGRPHEWIQARLDSLGKKNKALAEAMGVAESRVSEMIAGGRLLKVEEVDAFARVLEIDIAIVPRAFREHQLPPPSTNDNHDNHRPAIIDALGDKYAAVPRWQIEASAGGGNAIIPEPESRYRLLFRSEWLRGITHAPLDEIITVQVAGNSMEPTLLHGDLVLADRTDTTPREDAIFVIDDNHEAKIKRVLVDHSTGDLVLRSDNDLVKDSLPAPPSIRKIVGRVFWVGRNL